MDELVVFALHGRVEALVGPARSTANASRHITRPIVSHMHVVTVVVRAACKVLVDLVAVLTTVDGALLIVVVVDHVVQVLGGALSGGTRVDVVQE